MSPLAGYRLQSSQPNAQGLCTFVIKNGAGLELASIDRPCTLEEAITAARKFVEEMEEEEIETQ